MEYLKSYVMGIANLDDEMRGLKRKLQLLESKVDDVKVQLKMAEYSSNEKQIRKEVKNWLANVERTKHEVRQIEQEAQDRKRWHTRLQLQKTIEKATKEVKTLFQEGQFPKGVTLEAYEDGGVALLTKKLVGQKFQTDKNMICDWLLHGGFSLVGIYGMGGVGKTTLVKHIHNQLRDSPGIRVCWITVSQNFVIHKLQSNIAKRLNFDLSKENDERIRATKLANAMMKRKNCVLILDDVWDNFPLERVGICVGVNGCKLVLTTRSLEVCRKMNCENQVKVDCLPHEEAWELFMETLGNKTMLSSQIEGIAKSLTKACGGLPLAIKTMAGSMRGVSDVREWSSTLEEIQASKYKHDHDIEFYEVFRVLKCSYDKLKDPKVQQCFLYCSLFPEDYSIRREKLIEYFIDEGLLSGMGSRESEFNKGHVILNRLENVCLLEGQNHGRNKYVKMHDLVREMATEIASNISPRFWVQAGKGLGELPKEGWSEDLVKVSLMSNAILDVPANASPRCPQLSTVLLRENNYLKVIPSCFFTHMNSLSVLDVSNTSIETLPVSISNLEGLTALLLENCELLSYVPSLAKLKALRRLDLSGTKIEELPEGMEMLRNLRYLNIDGCLCLQRMPPGILPKLSNIQYFRSGVTKLRGQEIASWRKIENLKGQFHRVDDLNTCVRSWNELEGPNNYLLLVGWDFREWFVDLSYSIMSIKKVYLMNVNESGASEDTLLLPTSTQLLSIEKCHFITSLCNLVSLKKSTALRDFGIKNSDGIKHVVCSSCCDHLPFVKSLESLVLIRLPNLTDLIWRDQSTPSSSTLPTGTFSSLKLFKINDCHNIKCLFTPTLFLHLQNLETLKVGYCKQLQKIIGEGASDHEDGDGESTSNTILLLPPKLKSMELSYLPKLNSFGGPCSIKVSDSLEKVVIHHCPELNRITLLSEEPGPSRSLQKINVEKDWWDSLEWKHPQTKHVLEPFCHFIQ